MKVEILQEAEEELNQAIVRYEEIEAGLGIRLKEEARLAIRWIGDNPELPRLRPKGYRRVNFKVFPCLPSALCFLISAFFGWSLIGSTLSPPPAG